MIYYINRRYTIKNCLLTLVCLVFKEQLVAYFPQVQLLYNNIPTNQCQYFFNEYYSIDS